MQKRGITNNILCLFILGYIFISLNRLIIFRLLSQNYSLQYTRLRIQDTGGGGGVQEMSGLEIAETACVAKHQ